MNHPILMYDGSIKPIQDIVVGDYIMGGDSQPRCVLQLCRGRGEMFKITPKNGKPFIVNGDHVLSLVCTNEGKNQPCYKNGGEIDNISVYDYMQRSKSWKHLRKLYYVPVEYSKNTDLPIPPYIMGILLGDGCFRGEVSLSNPDQEIENAWCDYVESLGYQVNVSDETGRCPDYRIHGTRGKINIFTQILDQMGLYNQSSGTKFIPEVYLTASRNDRLALLAGLIDTDGHCAHGFYDYITKSRELATDIAYLAKSLGFAVYSRLKYCHCQTGHGDWFYRLSINGDGSVIPCRLLRKKACTRQQKKNVLRTGFSVEPAGTDDYYGFTIDGDHLYVDGNFMVHHNSGKTPVLASICKDAVEKWAGRVLILSHVKELLGQAAEKLSAICPEIPVGIYSAGLGERTTQGPIIIAGIQSVYQKAQELGKFDLIIIDEAHLIAPDGDGMYRHFLSDMKAINPNIRLIGLTATPFRMSSGLICGSENILNDICYEIGIKELIAQGYLCPLISKGSSRKLDYSKLHIRAGEFVSSEVDELVNTDNNVHAACHEIIEKTADRNRVLIFAASVEHAVNVKKTLEKMTGLECGMVTGSTPPMERDQLLRRFKGETVQANLFNETCPDLKYMVNINVLTTGFDNPQIDCVVMLRPTASPGLYVQTVGRGFRLHDTKKDCLVLDFAGNIMRHGPVDMIRIRDKVEGGNGDAPVKECPECNLIIHAAYSICPGCGHEFPKQEHAEHEGHASEENVLSCDETNEYEVEDVFYAVHQKAGADDSAPKTMRVDYKIGRNQFRSEWLCVEHEGWPRKKFERWWNERTKAPLPSSAYEAVQVSNSGALAKPSQITVVRKAGEKYERVSGYVLGPVPDEVPDINSNPVYTCDQCLYYCDGWCSITFQSDLLPDTNSCGQFLDKEDIPF